MGFILIHSHAEPVSSESQLLDIGLVTDDTESEHDSDDLDVDLGIIETDPHVPSSIYPRYFLLYLTSLGYYLHTSLEQQPMLSETRLPDMDPASLSLHKALHHFYPATPYYAETMSVSGIALPGSDVDTTLYDADKLAHKKAVLNGGLIMYWYGVPNPKTGMNLATCIWQSRKHAVAANSRPHHIRAMMLAAASYEISILWSNTSCESHEMG
ncbi:hypothetical protein F4604DRAFT_1914763 [Suillus subluteus]|nr:hypothetical protein F4604DRAFT_1914763 [Suillus subluteus]